MSYTSIDEFEAKKFIEYLRNYKIELFKIFNLYKGYKDFYSNYNDYQQCWASVKELEARNKVFSLFTPESLDILYRNFKQRRIKNTLTI